MRLSVRALGLAAFGLVLVAACGGGGSNKSSSGDAGSGSSSGGGSGSSGGTGSSGSSSGGLTPIEDAGAFPPAGNPDGTCKTLPLPAEAQLVDTSKPTTVVGTGTAASCTFDALNTAVGKGGIITFDCGSAPVTIPVTATLQPPISKGSAPAVQIVIDGGNLVTLDGQGSVRILSWLHDTWRTNEDTLTLQRIRLINGKTTPTQAIPACPPSGIISNTECSTGYDDGQGGALYMQDGNLRVIDSIFENNQAALLGPDTGGGALYLFGTGAPSYIVGSSFLNNTASNAGGVGMLWAGAFIFNSLFQGNSAVGNGANSNDATKCTCDNGSNDNQIGSGGNGGAIYKDGGDGVNLTICGTEIKGNTANEFGPAVFLTADGSSAQLVIDDSTITENSTPIGYWQWCTDVSTDNPHSSTGGSPSPVNTTFCNASGAACTSTCSS
jgi:hypothetical protein